jgi:hypothetical protein
MARQQEGQQDFPWYFQSSGPLTPSLPLHQYRMRPAHIARHRYLHRSATNIIAHCSPWGTDGDILQQDAAQ